MNRGNGIMFLLLGLLSYCVIMAGKLNVFVNFTLNIPEHNMNKKRLSYFQEIKSKKLNVLICFNG